MGVTMMTRILLSTISVVLLIQTTNAAKCDMCKGSGKIPNPARNEYDRDAWAWGLANIKVGMSNMVKWTDIECPACGGHGTYKQPGCLGRCINLGRCGKDNDTRTADCMDKSAAAVGNCAVKTCSTLGSCFGSCLRTVRDYTPSAKTLLIGGLACTAVGGPLYANRPSPWNKDLEKRLEACVTCHAAVLHDKETACGCPSKSDARDIWKKYDEPPMSARLTDWGKKNANDLAATTTKTASNVCSYIGETASNIGASISKNVVGAAKYAYSWIPGYPGPTEQCTPCKSEGSFIPQNETEPTCKNPEIPETQTKRVDDGPFHCKDLNGLAN